MYLKDKEHVFRVQKCSFISPFISLQPMVFHHGSEVPFDRDKFLPLKDNKISFQNDQNLACISPNGVPFPDFS